MKKLLPTISLLFLSSFYLYGQNLDSLYNLFVNISRGNENVKTQLIQSGEFDHKCGFGLVTEIKSNFNYYTPAQQVVLSELLQRPAADTSFITPSGHFRVHFSLDNSRSPKYDLNELAVAIDSTFNYEVNILNYPPPPGDGNTGGDDKYDIYITNLGFYGYTENETLLGNNKWTGFTVIDNDFSGLYTTGIDGAKVTIAHEFHHAIQMGNYILRTDDRFYYEITSTAMEEFVFNDVNDYYQYLITYFSHPNRTISSNDGYNLAIWNIFLKDKYGYDILKRIWELMPGNRALKSIALAIMEYGSSYKSEFNDFGIWTYFTNYRTTPGKYFDEAENYPLIVPLTNTDYISPETSIQINTEPVSNNFLTFSDNSSTVPDTLVAVITDADFQNGIDSPSSRLSFNFSLSESAGGGYSIVNDKYFSKITGDGVGFIEDNYIFNNVPVDEGPGTRKELSYAFPQPFKYKTGSFLYMPVEYDQSGISDINIYTVGMDLVYSSTSTIFVTDKILVKWNGLDNNNNRLPTGIYIYVAKSGDKIKKGKIVIYNE